MKRNSKFLLLLALIMSGIIGVYFISCGGDEITNPPPPDKVIGSVHGVVTNDIDNSPLPGVQVAWVNKGETHTATSDTFGYFVTDGVLGSGDYGFTFSVNGYSVRRATTVIPDIDSLRGEPGTPVSGDIPFSRQLDIDLFPLTATVTGRVFTALPSTASGKETETPSAADGPPASAAANVPVHIRFDTLYPYYWYDEGAQGKDDQQEQALNGDPIALNISPNDYLTTTNTSGVYEFLNLPAVTGGWIMIYTDPYPGGGDTLYRSETTFVQLLPNVSVTAPDIYTPVAGDMARVIQTNFETGKFPLAQDLEIDFSDKMDTAKVEISLTANCPPSSLSFGISWSDENRHLTIDPTFDLVPDCFYQIGITGTASNGNPLLSFSKTFATIDGMRFVSTNLDDYSGTPGYFLDFPLDANIDLCFNMVPDLTNPNTMISLVDTLSGQQVDNSASVNGNCVVIDPSNPLESNRTYRLYFNIYSTLSVDDYVPDSEVLPGAAPLIITVECTEAVPGLVTGFDLVSPDVDDIDWNTTVLTFKWNVVPEADYYEIYAKDNHKNTDFTKVDSTPAVDYVTWQEGSVDFGDPANWQFDLYQDDTLCPPFDTNTFPLPLITPFSGGNAITFQVRAVNTCHGGQYGPFSSSVTLEDEVAPYFELDQDSGNADQVGKSGVDIFIGIEGDFGDECWAWIEYAENVDPTFEFIEGGGSLDPAPSPVIWDWEKEIRDGWATFTVPAGTAAAGDTLVVSIADNSGNVGVDTIRLLPWFQFIAPVADSGLEAGETDVKWATDNAPGDNIIDVRLWLSFDSGTTWIDSTPTSGVSNTGLYMGFAASIDDTTIIDDSALVRLQDAAGGCYWYTDVFTISGIMLTSPDSASYFANQDTILDGGNTDSTEVPIAWNSTAFISEVVISYFYTGAPNWVETDTIVNTGSFNFVPPSRGAQYNCWLRVSDADANRRPTDSTSWYFTVLHDTIEYIVPVGGEAPGGSVVYNIRWDNGVGFDLPSLLDIDYAVDAATDTNWVELADMTENDGIYTWDTVPYTTATDDALIRILAADSTEYISDFFTISGLVITSPVGGEDWDVGSSKTITWDNYGSFSGNVDLEYSVDGGSNWSIIDNDVANTEFYVWDPIPNRPSDQVLVRVTEYNGLIQDMSDSAFTIAGFTITDPNGGETWLEGRFDTVTWNVTPALGDSVEILFSIDNGANYNYTLTAQWLANSGLLEFTVPVTLPGPFPYNQCLVLIHDLTGTAVDTSDAVFTIDQPNITITDPDTAGIAWQTGTLHDITWTSVGLLDTLLIISLDTTSGGGGYPILIDTVSATTNSYPWTIPNLGVNPVPTCRIMVSEIDFPLNGESSNDFQVDP